MSKKVLIISTSFRKNGNSDTLANAFSQGAENSGNTVEMIRLAEKNDWLLPGLSRLSKNAKMCHS